jgi:hypothetical protein
MTWRASEMEWRVSPTEIYVVSRAHGGDDAWAATYQGPGMYSVDIDAIDTDGHAIWWENAADAQLACAAHRLRMEAGDTAEEAALCVRVSTPRDLEIDLGHAAEEEE